MNQFLPTIIKQKICDVQLCSNVAWAIKALNASSDRNRRECGWSLTSRQNYKALLFCLLVIPCFRERVLFQQLDKITAPPGGRLRLSVCMEEKQKMSLLRYIGVLLY